MAEQETSKQKKLKVDVEKFLSIVKENGLSILDQAGYHKCMAAKGRQVYVAKTKEVGRVDISGFEMPATPGVRDLRGERFGGVKQQLDFEGGFTEEQVLEAFRTVVKHMVSLPAAEAKKKKFEAKPIAPTPGTAAVPEVQGGDAAYLLPTGRLNPEQKAKRLQLIKDTYSMLKENGRLYAKREHPFIDGGISQKAIEELS
jgi:hypothetical protein